MRVDLGRAVVAALARSCGRDPRSIELSTRLREDLALDSLDVIELLIMAEDEFGVIVPDDRLAEIGTVGDLVSLLATLAAGPSIGARAIAPST